MGELWDIYDKNRKKTGKTAERDVYELKEGEYHIVVIAAILNSKNNILISKRAPYKKYGLMWDCCGGSILAGETSLEGILREVKEELGITFTKKEAIFLKTIRKDKVPPNFRDIWLFKKDIDIQSLTFPDKEAIEARWVTIDEFMEMYRNNEIIPTIDFKQDEYNQALNISQRESYNYIGKIVNVVIDKPIGCAPLKEHPDHIYPINYGYVPNTISGDGEELDCYILGIDKPIKQFTGKCIAVIHRTNDDDDKLIIVPEGEEYTDEEIKEKTHFQERFFESEIIR